MRRRTVAAALALVVCVGAVGCSGGKPSKDDYREAMVSQTREQQGELDQRGEAAVDCLVDESYDDLSAETVAAVVDGDDDYEAPDADQEVMLEAMETCMPGQISRPDEEPAPEEE